MQRKLDKTKFQQLIACYQQLTLVKSRDETWQLPAIPAESSTWRGRSCVDHKEQCPCNWNNQIAENS